MKLTLYAKPGCHLCDELRDLLEVLQPEWSFDLDEINIEADAAVYARYRYAIPVLLIDGEEAGRGRIAEAQLLAALRHHRTTSR